ncbi:MAG: leucine-rich repeat protein [Bacteroidales bacterium]|nr:leucine-rich repeat protein [Bacteroidales bacterium]
MRCKGLITTVLLLLLCVGRAVAYDFAATAPSGQTLYYAYVDGGVAVVHPNSSTVPTQSWNNYQRPTGSIMIPSTVEYNNVSYNVVEVGEYAFFGCDAITSVSISEGVVVLRNGAFRECISLTSVVLPSTVDTLGRTLFWMCNALRSLDIHRPTPPECAGNAFYELPLAQCTLTVPNGATASYGAVAPWSSFGTIVEAIYDVTIAATANYEQRGTVEGEGVYPMGTTVTLTAEPAEGYFFACWQDGDTLNPRAVTATPGAYYVAHFFAYRHDTVHVVDSIMIHPLLHTLTVTSADPWRGLVAGNTIVMHGTIIEIAAIPLGNNTFTAWSDGNTDNPRRVTVENDITLTASFATNNCIVGPETGSWSVSVDGQRIAVRCGVGETVRLFDLQGRCLLTLKATATTTHIDALVKGVYLVSVGTDPAKKIITE